ncbi:MAG: hypothetical protein HYZ72_10800 [Deltaproteobacteria bacterium]|nr:hypothetical protein [Deltaproteobacteria bacterium]
MFSITPPASLLTLVLSVVLFIAGVGVAVYLLLLVFSALTDSFGELFERTVFRRYGARCERGDALLEKGDFAGAVRVFGDAFFLRPVRWDSTLLSDIANYHTGLLSRLLTVADEMGKGRARLPSLADADRLLAERLEIHLDYFRALRDGDEQRVREIERSLRENEAQVRAAVSRLIEEIRSSEERVLYH